MQILQRPGVRVSHNPLLSVPVDDLQVRRLALPSNRSIAMCGWFNAASRVAQGAPGFAPDWALIRAWLLDVAALGDAA